jgi:hypothetical protein
MRREGHHDRAGCDQRVQVMGGVMIGKAEKEFCDGYFLIESEFLIPFSDFLSPRPDGTLILNGEGHLLPGLETTGQKPDPGNALLS